MARIKFIDNPHYFGMRIEKSIWHRLSAIASNRKESVSQTARKMLINQIENAELEN